MYLINLYDILYEKNYEKINTKTGFLFSHERQQTLEFKFFLKTLHSDRKLVIM